MILVSLKTVEVGRDAINELYRLGLALIDSRRRAAGCGSIRTKRPGLWIIRALQPLTLTVEVFRLRQIATTLFQSSLGVIDLALQFLGLLWTLLGGGNLFLDRQPLDACFKLTLVFFQIEIALCPDVGLVCLAVVLVLFPRPRFRGFTESLLRGVCVFGLLSDARVRMTEKLLPVSSGSLMGRMVLVLAGARRIWETLASSLAE